MSTTIAASEGIPLVKADLVLEGGSVHTDGEGCAVQNFLHACQGTLRNAILIASLVPATLFSE